MILEVELDDELLAHARELTGIDDLAELVDAALRGLVEREAARRLAALGGSVPHMRAPPRRRPTG